MGWRGGEESRYPGNSCCSVEQMALGGAVMAAAPGHPPQQPGRPEQTADSTHGYKRVSRAALMCSTNLPLSLSSRVSIVNNVRKSTLCVCFLCQPRRSNSLSPRRFVLAPRTGSSQPQTLSCSAEMGQWIK